MSRPQAGWERRGPEALEVIDQILAERPKKEGEKLTAATQKLCAYREGLIARAEQGGPDERRDLEHVNAVLSIVAGIHFPLGSVPWSELEGARGWLQTLIARTGPTRASAQESTLD